jgi:hypothetical protein
LVADCARLNGLKRSTLQNEGAREGSSLAVEWPNGSAVRPVFPILNESVEAGRVDDSPLIVGTTAVDRKSTLDARPITKRRHGSRMKDKARRSQRNCMRCQKYGGQNAETCQG